MIKGLIFLCCVILYHVPFAQSWHRVMDFPGAARDDGTSFVLGNSAYCGTGVLNGSVTTHDFYRYGFDSDQWDTIASLPTGKERQYAMGYSCNGKGYVFGGYRNGTYLNDLWEYDPNQDVWNEKSGLPSAPRSGMSGFVIGDSIFVVGGKNDTSEALREVWVYLVSSDTWVEMADLPFGGRWRASGIQFLGNGYLCFGRDENGCFCKGMYRYDHASDDWTKIGDFPGNGRAYSAMEVVKDELIVLAGLDTFGLAHNDLWNYDVKAQQWRQLESLPAKGRRGGISFSDGYSLFYTTGKDQSHQRFRETWKSDHIIGIDQLETINMPNIYPNPTKDFLNIDLYRKNELESVKYIVSDLNGRRMLHGTCFVSQSMVYVGELPKGLYIIEIQIPGEILVKRFVKN